MSFRRRPSLSSKHCSGRSSTEMKSDVDLAQLRQLLSSAKALPCFQTRPKCQSMIDDVLQHCLPIAVAAEASATDGLTQSDGLGIIDMSVDQGAMDLSNSSCNRFEPDTVSFNCAAGVAAGVEVSCSALKKRGSGVVEKVRVSKLPDRAWTIVLDYLELGEGMRCRELGRCFRDTVEASLSVLALSGVNSIAWATPENLLFLTRFKNVRTLHWYVGVGMPSNMDEFSGAAVAAGEPGAGAGTGASNPPLPGNQDGAAENRQIVPGDRFGAAAGESALRAADCNPVRAWAYLIGALPKIEEVIIVEGADTHEMALEEVWLHLLPLCKNLRSFFLNFEDYSKCPVDGDHPPINVKKFAVFLRAKKPFPKLRELHLELGSMSIAEQRSLIRGLSMSGLLPQLEKVTLGDGTTSYIRSPGKGPGRDLYTAFTKSPCARLKVLWLQRLDLWDDLEGLAAALGPEHCPVLEELFLDLALDTDDVKRLAKCLHKFPACLKTLGVLAVAIKDRTSEGVFQIADPMPALQKLADALAAHPRSRLQCLDVSMHFEPAHTESVDGAHEIATVNHELLYLIQDQFSELAQHTTRFQARKSATPIMELLKTGVLTGLKHVQLSSCSLDDQGLLAACKSVSGMRGLQTLDLSSNRLSKTGAESLAESLWQCRSLHEIVLDESVREEDMPLVKDIFKLKMPWATVRVEDRTSQRARRVVGTSDSQFYDDMDGDIVEDGELMMDAEDGDDLDLDASHWDDDHMESDGEVPPELMVYDSDVSF